MGRFLLEDEGSVEVDVVGASYVVVFALGELAWIERSSWRPLGVGE